MTNDPPGIADLVRAVRELLEHDTVRALDGARAYDVRVAIHVLGIVERELRVTDVGDATTLAALAEALRARNTRYDDPDVLSVLRADAEARLAVANPKYAHARRTPD